MMIQDRGRPFPITGSPLPANRGKMLRPRWEALRRAEIGLPATGAQSVVETDMDQDIDRSQQRVGAFQFWNLAARTNRMPMSLFVVTMGFRSACLDNR